MAILLFQTAKLLALEGILLHVRPVVGGESGHLGNQLGIEPIGVCDRRFEIVDHQRLGHAAKLRKRILQRAQEVVGRLPVDRFAVGFAAVRQNDAKDVRPPTLSVGTDDRGAAAEIDLRFFTRHTFDTAEWLRAHPAQPFEKSPYTVVADSGPMLTD
jgi:hypothetical protein